MRTGDAQGERAGSPPSRDPRSKEHNTDVGEQWLNSPGLRGTTGTGGRGARRAHGGYPAPLRKAGQGAQPGPLWLHRENFSPVLRQPHLDRLTQARRYECPQGMSVLPCAEHPFSYGVPWPRPELGDSTASPRTVQLESAVKSQCQWTQGT